MQPSRADAVLEMTSGATAATLITIGALHVAWGRNSTFPFSTRHELNDAVIGRQVTPSPVACYTVACLLAAAAFSVERAARTHGPIARLASAGVAATLATRAALGFSGRTDLAVPGSNSPRFRMLDRTLYAPLCAALAAGAAQAAASRGPQA
jgi:hypothetical protein